MKKVVAWLLLCVMFASICTGCGEEPSPFWPYDKTVEDFPGYGENGADFDQMLALVIEYVTVCETMYNASDKQTCSSMNTDEVLNQRIEALYESAEEISDRDTTLATMNIYFVILQFRMVLAEKNLYIGLSQLSPEAAINPEWFERFNLLLTDAKKYLDNGTYLSEGYTGPSLS